MALVQTENSLLLQHFRRFYSEVLHLKLRLERSHAAPAAGSSAVVGIAAPAATTTALAAHANDAWCSLVRLLEVQSAESGRVGGAFTYEVYREAQYVMAALADEIFLNANWPGRENWPLLEHKLFHSHASGEIFFQRIDQLLQDRSRSHSDLAMIYFQAIALGFRGKYRDHDERGELEQYRRRLFMQIYHRAPQDLVHDRTLFPQSYMPTLDEGDGRKLPNPRTWLWALAGVGVLWLAVSGVLWHHLTADVYTLIHSIQSSPSAQWSGHL
jgi:type VI secretion system protein ImpK